MNDIEYFKGKVLCDKCNEWHEITLRRDLTHDEMIEAAKSQPCKCQNKFA
jgi:hypothetical protein